MGEKVRVRSSCAYFVVTHVVLADQTPGSDAGKQAGVGGADAARARRAAGEVGGRGGGTLAAVDSAEGRHGAALQPAAQRHPLPTQGCPLLPF